MTVTDSDQLVKDLKRLLRDVEADLRTRSEDPEWEWSRELRSQYAQARERGRTALTWSVWRDGEVDLAAVAWVLASVFVRFCEDNELLDQAWITGVGERAGYALDAESAFYLERPSRNARDWLRAGFGALADLPAGAGILDRSHSPVWSTPLSADACTEILQFWREQNADGSLRRSLASDTWDTRFLGDIYQDLSEFAKKKYALLQTPVFVEEFILDQTLEPALEEFGLQGLRLIDPACGSGHFLLGAFARLLDRWDAQAPGMDRRERVQAALDHVHGVDLNPFAIAIARFRLTIAALRASGLTRLRDAPKFDYHLAVGDSLLAGTRGRQGDLLDDDEGLAGFAYAAEDVLEHPGILEPGRYHVVVANPPYITVKDPALNAAYREAYPNSCHRQYALSVPFMELLFRLSQKGDATQLAGYVGQITSNSFMKREFGSKVIEGLLAGNEPDVPVDLTAVIDTSGAYIPGHGTPTVILIGRKQRGTGTVRAVLGVRGEPGQPADAATGLVWTQIIEHADDPGFDGEYVSVTDLDRATLATFPWSLSGGGAASVFEVVDQGPLRLGEVVKLVGYTGQTNTDEVFLAPAHSFRTRHVESAAHRQLVIGRVIRDLQIDKSDHSIFLYDDDSLLDIHDWPGAYRWMWPTRTVTWNRATFGKMTYRQEGRSWWEWHQVSLDRLRTPLSIAFAFVATHNHFVLDRGGKVFNRSAPVIKLPVGASEDDHLALLGVLNSSTACFWLKQVSHNKGSTVDTRGARQTTVEWENFYEFTGTKLQEFPLPAVLPLEAGRELDQLAGELALAMPGSVCAEEAPTRQRLESAHDRYASTRRRMIAAQEELDWQVYGLYDLSGADLTYQGDGLPALELGQRAFEIVLARRVAEGSEESAWFERHGSTAITEIPAAWPSAYRELVQRRIDLIESDRSIGSLERPEFKRRWAAQSWQDMEHAALANCCLDCLEAPELWRDDQGPRVLSVAALAGQVRNDAELVEALRLWAGTPEIDVAVQLGKLLADQAVPFLAAYRYKEPGLVKRGEWEAVWDMQRREDAGETLDIPVPPKYAQADFRKSSFWKARGKLDVPKERFVSFPGAGHGADTTEVLGWAGWDHYEQAQALARLLLQRATQDGWNTAQLKPLIAGLAELEPWLHQWYDDVDPEFGQSRATMITGLVDQQLAQHGLTRADLAGWRPAATTTRRRKS